MKTILIIMVAMVTAGFLTANSITYAKTVPVPDVEINALKQMICAMNVKTGKFIQNSLDPNCMGLGYVDQNLVNEVMFGKHNAGDDTEK